MANFPGRLDVTGPVSVDLALGRQFDRPDRLPGRRVARATSRARVPVVDSSLFLGNS